MRWSVLLYIALLYIAFTLLTSKVQPLKNDRWRIPKSRYASNSTYISQDPRLRPEYMDPELVVDPAIKKRLMAGGMDELLATHFAHLFIRDPIVVFAEDLQKLDLSQTNHFENLQSTNWQHIRFKPPPAENDIGWRVEFRPMEIQMTDFENAAFSIFMVLITRAILSFDLNFYIPIARTTENMERAHGRDAVRREKFYFRKDPFPHAPRSRGSTPPGGASKVDVESEYELMSISDIINGSTTGEGEGGGFPGLIPLVESYLNSLNVDVETRCALAKYLELIRRRADGRAWTNARWMREFVAGHAGYGGDSVVSEQMSYDLVQAVEEVSEGGSIGREMFP